MRLDQEDTALRRLVIVIVTVALLAGGCGVSGLAFTQDDRLTFLAPEERSEVTLPLTVRWQVGDFEVGVEGSFAVFVDRAPMPPGKTLAWLARDDVACRPAQGCPDAQWFRDRYVFQTTSSELTIETLPAHTDDRREHHEVTVVLVDEDGRRVGETGWTIEFQVKRD